MKKTASLLSAFVLLALIGGLPAQDPPAKDGGNHLGTWRLISTKYGDEKEFSDFPSERQRLKMITPTHFSWVDYDTKTKKISSSAGGSYSLRDTVYIEKIEFVGEGMEAYLEKEQKFTLKVNGDQLLQSGQLSDGLKIEEVWQRVKRQGKS